METMVTTPRQDVLLCRRHAPKAVSGLSYPQRAAWPVVHPEDWCGEWVDRASDPHDYKTAWLDPGNRNSPHTP
jgi:hypothetical protein